MRSDETTAQVRDFLNTTTAAELREFVENEFDAYEQSTQADRRSSSMLEHIRKMAWAGDALESDAVAEHLDDVSDEEFEGLRYLAELVGTGDDTDGE